MKKLILQLFQWKLSDIINHLEEIKDKGYNFIQISPIQPTKDAGFEWWKLYQPLGFSIGNTQIGNKKELIVLCKKANELDIKIIVDVVVNHVASDEKNSLLPHKLVDKKLTRRKDFWKEKKFISNWENRNEVITLSNGLPCLRLDNHDLQDIIIDFLNELVDCGVGGFRIDSAKSIALPCEGSDFWERVISGIKDKTLFNYAEVIFTPTHTIDEYNKYINVTTSCHASDKSKIVGYVENHDTFLDSIIGYTRDMSNRQIANEWRILVTNFDNCLYYARPYDYGWASDDIKYANLIA